MDIKNIISTAVSDVIKDELGNKIEEDVLSGIADKITSRLSKSIGADELVLLGIKENENTGSEMAVVSVIGEDSVGIVADVAMALKENSANIEGMNQAIVSGYFALILTIDVTNMKISIHELQSVMDGIARDKNLKIYIQHENIFKSMNRV